MMATMMRLVLTTLLILPLTGCVEPKSVIDELPPPVVRIGPTSPASPRPVGPSEPEPSARSARSITEATIVIDAGHGGKDPGAWPRGLSRLPEKTIVLAVANDVARLLRERGARVVTTRTTDVFIELDDRAATAERTRADLLVSIHADASENKPDISGATVYIDKHASLQSQRAARSIYTALKRARIETRGVHRHWFRLRVLAGHSRPAVLVECGFLTNATDARRLNTTAYRTRIADVIAEGIAGYFSP